MLTASVMLILNSLFLSLHLTGGAGSFPRPLTAEEEAECLKRMADGDIEARNMLIERNLRLVAHIIKKYYTGRDDGDDLISIGTIGLIKGISSYNAEKGVRLATYVSKCIENEILMYFRSRKRVSVEVLLSDSIDTDKDGNTLSLIDVISVADTMLDDLSARDTQNKLRKAVVKSLTPRESEIIRLRYGLDNRAPLTQREIAQKCGISRSYVSRIEKKALEKLRKCFEEMV
ncbi:MAG: RNA polymerase sporulation sigma factor SigK [Oscillospiraceae bacterium]